jgi:hypothetical protein
MQDIQRRVLVIKPDGGYCLIPVTRLYAALWLYRQGELEFRDVGIYLALEEMRARRCTLKTGRTPRYTLAELEELCGDVSNLPGGPGFLGYAPQTRTASIAIPLSHSS